MTMLAGASSTPLPPNPRRLADFFLDHNPLYLLSAALMLLGCYQLAGAIDVRAGEIGKLLGLLGVLNLYEFLLIGLAVFLWKSRGLLRDSTLLLLIEGLFLADLTFLNSEVAANDLMLGSLINAALFVLALAKLYVVVRFLKLERSPRTLVFITLQLGLLCALPILLRSVSVNGVIGPQPFYLMWWIVGLMPVVYDVLARFFWIRPAARDSTVRVVWTVLPWISLVAHLGFQHWVYRADFHIIELIPVLLGLAVIAPRFPAWVAPPTAAPFLRTVFGVVAMLIGLTNPGEFFVHVPGAGITLSPAMIAFAGTALTWSYCWRLAALPWTLIGLAMLGLVRFYGPSYKSVVACIEGAVGLVENGVNWITPSSSAGWGVVAMISAFVTLALGALVSLTRPKRQT